LSARYAPARSLASTACASPFLPPQPATWTVLSDRSSGRTWWAHFEFTRINITPTILPKKIEELRQLGAFIVGTGGLVNARPSLDTYRRLSGRQRRVSNLGGCERRLTKTPAASLGGLRQGRSMRASTETEVRAVAFRARILAPVPRRGAAYRILAPKPHTDPRSSSRRLTEGGPHERQEQPP
jgi:hypothetical protein